MLIWLPGGDVSDPVANTTPSLLCAVVMMTAGFPATTGVAPRERRAPLRRSWTLLTQQARAHERAARRRNVPPRHCPVAMPKHPARPPGTCKVECCCGFSGGCSTLRVDLSRRCLAHQEQPATRRPMAGQPTHSQQWNKRLRANRWQNDR